MAGRSGGLVPRARARRRDPTLLSNAAIDLAQTLESANGQDLGFDGYSNDMLTYGLCDSRGVWNQLEVPRPADDLDREIARALVCIADVMSAVEMGADIYKRCSEVLANQLFGRPATVDAIVEEAARRRLSPELASEIEYARARVAVALLERRG